MSRLRPASWLLVGALVLAGCGAPPPSATSSFSPGPVPDPPMTSTTLPAGAAGVLLTPAAFAAAMAEPGRVTIDVHVPFEGKLNAADLMIPYNEVAQRQSELPANRSTPLAIYCRSGFMSAIAAPELARLGFTDVVELSGGMDAWRASGRPLITTN